ncbi:MAG TPA: hypothetical protein VMY40_03015, partial [Anaerolineae bacterium]|nr:hypothetical protein [Anaerolineae bacterium]
QSRQPIACSPRGVQVHHRQMGMRGPLEERWFHGPDRRSFPHAVRGPKAQGRPNVVDRHLGGSFLISELWAMVSPC